MKRLYRWDSIGAGTKVYGVVGSPVGHSMSPAVHNAAFDQIGFDGVYVPLLVNEGYESFKAFMESFVSAPGMDLSGLSVTIPHKENALRYVQEKNGEVEALAATIGAVNTLIIDRSEGEIRIARSAPITRLFSTASLRKWASCESNWQIIMLRYWRGRTGAPPLRHSPITEQPW